MSKNFPQYHKKENILERIEKSFKYMSKTHKIIAEYIQQNYDKAAYMTAQNIAAHLGTSEATVVRFSQILGYDGYYTLKKSLQDVTKSKLTTVQRIDMDDFGVYNTDLIKNILYFDVENIKRTIQELDTDNFTEIVDQIIDAPNIYLIGCRTSSILVDYLGFYLNMLLGGNTKIIREGVSNIYEQLVNVREKDVVIGITFPRYSGKTLDYIEFSKKRGCSVISLTDSEQSPIVPLSDYVLYAKSNIISFVDTLVAPLSLINAIVLGVGLRNKEKTKEVFGRLESIWNDKLIYDK